MRSKFFIDRPILSIALAIAITLVGVIGYFHLPVEQFPDIAPPVVEVSADYNGASAEAVQKSVIVPLEEAINGVDGIDYITSSSSSNGSAFISVTFKPGYDPDMAVVNVKNHVGEAEGILPAEVLETGVHVEKEQQSYLKVIALECPDNRYDNDFISNYFNINISPRLQRISGVSRVQLLGNLYAMRIWMDPKKMAQFDLDPHDIEEALNSQNIEAAIGTLGEDSKNTFQHTLVYRGRLANAEEFGNIVLRALPDGDDLRLRDVARCELGTESYSNDSRVNYHHGVVAILTQATGSNARQVNHEIDQLMELLKPTLPPGLEFKVLLDTNHFLDASMHEVYETLIEAILLVVLVVLLFLQNVRATLIPTFAILVSLTGTFAFMYVVGFSLNLITLFALVLVIGTVVDDAIVVVEAVQSQFESGEHSPYLATVKAMGNIGTAVITTTIVFMCVFIPTSFIGGLSGTYYKQFGLTMAVAVALSTINALTLSPALCALLMKAPAVESKDGQSSFFKRFATAFSTSLATMTEKYNQCLSVFVHHRWIALGLTLITLVLLFTLSRQIPTSLIPDEDTGNLFVDITTPAGSTLEQTKKTVEQASKAIEDIDEIETSASVAGWNILGGEGANTGILIMKLKHWDDRPGEDHHIYSVLEEIEAKMEDIKTANMFVFPLPTVTGYGFSGGIELYVQDFEDMSVEKLKEVTDKFLEALNEREEIGEAYSSYEVNYPQYTVSVNAAICKRYGIEPSDVLSILNGYVGGNYASQFNAYGKLFHVMLQADPKLRADKDDLNNIFVTTESGAFLPITSVVSLEKSYGVQSLNRFNLFSSINVEISPEDGYSTGDAIKAIGEVAAKTLPHGYGYEYTGTTREEVSTSGRSVWVFALVIFFVYLVLCSLYESLLIPLAVLLSIPFGLLGSYLMALVFQLENNIYMQVGIIMLIGLLAKTAILLTEYASSKRREGMSIKDSALSSAKARLRPIMMTALTLIIGLLPLAFSSGAGAVGNISLSLCVIGGMLVGTVSLLFFVPIFFMFFQFLEEKYMPRRVKPSNMTTVVLLSSLLFTSCKTYSDYEAEKPDTHRLLRNEFIQSGMTTDSILKDWREVFTEPQLVALIEEGLRHNSDLSIAKLQVEAARADLRQSRSELFPSLDFGANGEASRFKNTTDNESSASFSLGLEASWEVDIFGKLQNGKKAAQASLEEQEAFVQATIVELIATIATSYYQLEMYDTQIKETLDILDSWNESIRALKALMAAGEATADEVSQSEASRLEAEATLEELKMQSSLAENALCSLIGRESGHIDRSDFHQSCQRFPQTIRVNIQALANRPDIRQAEAELKSAFYATNMARAAFYPSLNLGGNIGWTNDAGDIVSPAGLLTRALASLTQPIFNKGQLRADLKKAELSQEEAKLSFQQAILDAGKEVNDALSSAQYAHRAISLCEQQVEKLNHVLDVTKTRMKYDSEVNFLQVLVARQSLLEARLSLLEKRYMLVDAYIQLYRSLGGGCQDVKE